MIPTAMVAGFLAGFFGIGGGIITVPVLFYIFSNFGIDNNFLMHLAVGTSFSIIVPTAIVSVFTHYKHKAVDFNIVKSYGVFVILGVIAGTIFAASLKTKSLIIFFSILLYLLSINFFFQKKDSKLKTKFNLILKIILGTVVGFISSLTGIGGAIMNVPILKFFKYPINKAIGSSAAIGLLISVFGSIGFLSSGVYLDIKLPLSIGFINIPAFLIFIPITTVMARLGAKLLYKVERNIITKLFAIFLLFVATKLMFDYFQL
tara:strand:+ start:1468 stop:2250 length:783 start_codon:yes stop_codon:yes gene_type:complete